MTAHEYVNINSLIRIDPEFKNGDPVVAGTGLRVKRLAVWWKMGESPEDIARDYDHLSLEGAYAAITFYLANREAIDNQLAEELRLYDELAEQQRRERVFA